MNGQVEIQLQAAEGTHHVTGEPWRGLLVRCRPVGSRRPVRFIVVGADGQSLLDLIVAAVTVVNRHADAPGGETKQLELGSAAA